MSTATQVRHADTQRAIAIASLSAVLDRKNKTLPLHVQLSNGIADDFSARDLLLSAFDTAAAADDYKFHASLAFVAYVGFDAARKFAREQWADSRDSSRQYLTRIVTLAQRAHAAGLGPRIAEVTTFKSLVALADSVKPAEAKAKTAKDKAEAAASSQVTRPMADASGLPSPALADVLAAIGVLDDLAAAETLDRTAIQAAMGMLKAAVAQHA